VVVVVEVAVAGKWLAVWADVVEVLAGMWEVV
jgi:hypothetical protein